MKINIRYLKLSKQFLCIQLLSVYIYRQEEREDDFESKTEISLSCQLKAGKKLYTVFIYRIYHNIYCIYTHKTVTVLARPFEALSALQQINRPNSRILDFQNLESGPNFDQVALDSAATGLSFFTASLFILRGFFFLAKN